MEPSQFLLLQRPNLFIINPYLHSVDKSPLKQGKAKTYTVAVICEDSWLDSCDVVVPILPMSSHKGVNVKEFFLR
jgi:hypothetical protein